MSYHIPKCLKRRNKILANVEKEVSKLVQNSDGQGSSSDEEDVSKKMVCHLWNMIKEDPPCEGCKGSKDSKATSSGIKSHSNRKRKHSREKHSDSGNEVTPSGTYHDGRIYQVYNTTEIQLFDDNCAIKINDLILEHNVLIEQIQDIEKREEEGIKLLQEADEMWERMEEAYKMKIDETWKRQKLLTEQLEEIEQSTRNWKKAKKDTEFEITIVEKVKRELNETQERKKSKLKSADGDIANFERKLVTAQREIEAVEKSLVTKSKHSESVMETITNKIRGLSTKIADEGKLKAQKEAEGVQYINEARDDLQRIWKMLLEKKLQTEDLRIVQESFQNDIAILKSAFEDCKIRCKKKQEELFKQIKQYEVDIANMNNQCSRCNQMVDTSDVKNVCTDCARCLRHRECIRSGDTCINNPDKECVCVIVKHKFMDNVLETMNTVLQKQIKAGTGRAVGEVVLKCLERSINGKVDIATKKILKDFILTNVRKHLELTIVSGAVKTRCEMDEDTYKKLMDCINETKLQKVSTEDKSTNKKGPCKNWRDAECNCAQTSKDCLCSKKAPQTTLSEPIKGCSDFCGQYDRVVMQDEMKICASQNVAPPHDDSALEDFLISSLNKLRVPCKSGTCSGTPKVRSTTSKKSTFSHPVNVTSRPQDQQDTRVCCKDSVEKRIKCTQQSKNTITVKKDSNSSNIKSATTTETSTISTKSSHVKVHNCASQEATNAQKVEVSQKVETVKKVKKRKKVKPSPKKIKKEDDDVIELTRTPSGNPAMAFDEKMIDKINKKLDKSSDMQVNLRKLDSKRFSLEFSNVSSGDAEMAKVRKTASGNLVLDAPKNILDLKEKVQQETSPTMLEKSVGESVKLCIKSGCGKTTYIDGTISKTESGNFKVDVQHPLVLDDSDSKKEEKDLKCLEKTIISEFNSDPMLSKSSKIVHRGLPCTEDLPLLLKMIEDSVDQVQNPVLKKMNRQLEADFHLYPHQKPKTIQNLHQIRIFGLYPNELFEPPAVLRRTMSGHYLFIIDKEYDKEYRKAVFNNETDERVRVSKSGSGKFINIDLSCYSDNTDDTECSLAKTDSGHLKLMITDEELPLKAQDNSYDKVSNKKLNKAFENILCKIFPYNLGPDNKIKEVQNSLVDFSSKKFNLSPRSSNNTIKKTHSGKYMLILDSKAKQNFIDNVQQLLKKRQNIIPITSTENGDIKIEMTRNKQTNEKEYLRITPSGNLYLLVNDATVKELNAKNNEVSSHTRFMSDETTGTFCNANPDDPCCDESLCNCQDLLKDINDNDFAIDYNGSNSRQKSNDSVDENNENSTEYEENYGQISFAPNEYEQWFCMTDSSCMSYKNRCVSDSNDILEISSTCEEETLRSEVTLQQERISRVVNEFFWDHVNEIPYQLHAFTKHE